MLDYDLEAAHYDRTRGGEPRAAAAAEAIRSLLPPECAVVVDVACGTGIVTADLRADGRVVIGVDRSAGMLGVARTRLPGTVARADATRLPFASASVDAVTLVWLLHLVADPAAVLTEGARILRPDGVLITTVDKNLGHFTVHSDVSEVTEPYRRAEYPRATDSEGSLLATASALGLRISRETRFTGTGQGRSPRHWADAVRAGEIAWCRDGDEVADLCRQLGALPDQDRPRPDPSYRLIALTRARS